MRNNLISFLGMALLLAAILCVILTLSPEAEAIVTYTDNENANDAIWLETPADLDEVEIWRRSGGRINQDYWKFNASAGQHVQINFRKYDKYDDFEPPFEGGTYMLNYRVYHAGTSEVYRYTRTYSDPPTDVHKRDSWSYIVPDNTVGWYTIWVFVSTNQNRNHAYYWLNVTVEDPGDLNAVSEHSGTLDINSSYTADYDPVDYYVVDLSADASRGTFVTLDFEKTEADTDLVLEVWEHYPFGTAQNWHMLNRTTTGLALSQQVRFLATHTGTYTVRVARDFWDAGSTDYTLSITIGAQANDPDAMPADGMVISHYQKLRDMTIEMGYDTHDWYKVMVQAGDAIFKVSVDINDDNVGDGQGYEVVVYNETGTVLWTDSSVAAGPTYGDSVTVPPSGTTILFERNETLYVRFSADAGMTDRSIRGFRSEYDIDFELTNRPPQLVEPFDEVYEWDEDGGVNIFLNSHFFDPDGDKMEYFLLNRTTGWTYDVTGLAYWGWLNVSSPPEWSGNVTWTLKAQDAGQDGDDHKHFIDFSFLVHPVPDLPISNGTLVRQCEEEGASSANLRRLFYDVDSGPGGVLTFGHTDTGITEVEVVLDTVTGAVELVPGPDVFGKFTFEFYCTDDQDVRVTGTVELTVHGINDVPRITEPIPTVHMDEGGDPVEMNMSLHFHDVDGDELEYKYQVPTSERGVINVYHKGYDIKDHRVIIELTDDGFYGTVLVNVTCKDSEGTLIKQDMLVIVSNVPDPPSIDVFPAGNPGAIEETGSLKFEVTGILDADLPEEGLHTYTWFLDGEEVPDHNSSEFTYVSTYDDAGQHTVRVVVTDPSGLESVQKPQWTFQVNDKNRVPTVTILSPPAEVDEGKLVTMTAEGSDPDKDQLTYTWYLVGGTEEKVLGTGATLETKDLKAGSRMIEVEVSDGKGGSATTSHTIKVKAVDEGSGMSTWLAIIVVVVIVVVLVAVMMMRRGKAEGQPEARMDIESLQEEYDPSQGRGGTQYGESYQSGDAEWESYEER